MGDETSCREDQIPCGGVLVSKKLTKSGNAYLEFLRKKVCVCVFKEEWAILEQSWTATSKEEWVKLSEEKTLQPDRWQGCRNICLQLANGFKFFMTWQDYCEIINNAGHIDKLLQEDEGAENEYYKWEVNDSGLRSMEFFKAKEECVKHAKELMPETDVRIVYHKLDFPSPANLVYHVYMYMLERRIEELSKKNCAGCKRDWVYYDYKSHAVDGCMADWEMKIASNLDEVKISLTYGEVSDIFIKLCQAHKLSFHEHMLHLIGMLMDYGNITVDLLTEHSNNTHKRELLEYAIKTVYEMNTK